MAFGLIREQRSLLKPFPRIALGRQAAVHEAGSVKTLSDPDLVVDVNALVVFILFGPANVLARRADGISQAAAVPTQDERLHIGGVPGDRLGARAVPRRAPDLHLAPQQGPIVDPLRVSRPDGRLNDRRTPIVAQRRAAVGDTARRACAIEGRDEPRRVIGVALHRRRLAPKRRHRAIGRDRHIRQVGNFDQHFRRRRGRGCLAGPENTPHTGGD